MLAFMSEEGLEAAGVPAFATTACDLALLEREWGGGRVLAAKPASPSTSRNHHLPTLHTIGLSILWQIDWTLPLRLLLKEAFVFSVCVCCVRVYVCVCVGGGVHDLG